MAIWDFARDYKFDIHSAIINKYNLKVLESHNLINKKHNVFKQGYTTFAILQNIQLNNLNRFL